MDLSNACTLDAAGEYSTVSQLAATVITVLPLSCSALVQYHLVVLFPWLFDAGLPLCTDRLLLRCFTPADAHVVLEAFTTPEFIKYVGDRGMKNDTDALKVNRVLSVKR